MEVDRTVVIVGVILIIVLGFFVFAQFGGAEAGVSKGVSYASQYAGGGCGR